MYKVFDNYGEPLRQRFSSYHEAYCFLCIMGRFDWKIKEVADNRTSWCMSGWSSKY